MSMISDTETPNIGSVNEKMPDVGQRSFQSELKQNNANELRIRDVELGISQPSDAHGSQILEQRNRNSLHFLNSKEELARYVDVASRKRHSTLIMTMRPGNCAAYCAVDATTGLGCLETVKRGWKLQFDISISPPSCNSALVVSGDRNWEKGQQTGWIVSSLCRHFKKLIAGDTDEDHGAAVLWNAFALMHHIPRILDGRLPRELDDYGFVVDAAEVKS